MIRGTGAQSKIIYELQITRRPKSVSQLAAITGYAEGTVRKALAYWYKRGKLWRGTGHASWYDNSTVAWWWMKAHADREGLGQLYNYYGVVNG